MEDPKIKGPLTEIDEMIAPVISILNKKGYRTRFCCSGHCHSGHCFDGSITDYTYILFENILPDNIDIPHGFSHNLTKKISMKKK